MLICESNDNNAHVICNIQYKYQTITITMTIYHDHDHDHDPMLLTLHYITLTLHHNTITYLNMSIQKQDPIRRSNLRSQPPRIPLSQPRLFRIFITRSRILTQQIPNINPLKCRSNTNNLFLISKQQRRKDPRCQIGFVIQIRSFLVDSSRTESTEFVRPLGYDFFFFG